jgi:GAF domain-containing protein
VPSERQLAQTFVELADTLVAGFDVVDFLHTLANRCAELFEAAEAGVMLADQRGGLRVVASSSERARLLELFELQGEQGPCLDSFRTGQAFVAEDLADESGRWPLFSREAMAAGFRSAHSLPLRFRAEVIGALNLFSTEPGTFERDLAGAQAMADIATISILQARALRDARVLADQLQRALDSRVVIEQAKGVLAERTQGNLDDAFKMLRTYARNHNRRLHDVATAVISSLIPIEELGPVPRRPRKQKCEIVGRWRLIEGQEFTAAQRSGLMRQAPP